MKTNKIITTVSLAAMLSVFGAGTAIASDAKEINWLPMQQVISQVEASGFTDIKQVNRSPHGYHILANDAEGKPTRLLLNAESGEIVKQFEAKKQRRMGKRAPHKMPKHHHAKRQQHSQS